MAYFGRTALRRFARLFILFLRNKGLRIGVSVLFLLNLFLCSFLLLFFGLRLLLYLRLFLLRLFLLRLIRLLGNRCCGLFRSLLFVVRLYGCRLYLFLLRLGLFLRFFAVLSGGCSFKLLQNSHLLGKLLILFLFPCLFRSGSRFRSRSKIIRKAFNLVLLCKSIENKAYFLFIQSGTALFFRSGLFGNNLYYIL